MNLRKSAVLILIVSFCCLVFAGCKNTEKDNVASNADTKIRIGMSFDSFVIERWQRDRDVFVSTASDLGAEVTVQNANGDVQEQERQIRRFIEEEMDAIVIVPIDSEPLRGVVADAMNANIPVICYDRLISDAPSSLYISFNNDLVGSLMGEAMAQALPKGGKVLMVSGPKTDGNVSFVNDGFIRQMRENGITILDCPYIDDWKAELASAYLNEHMDLVRQVDGIMCGNDNMAGEVVRFLAEHQLAGKICVVGQDAELEACQRIIEGMQYMTVYKPVENLAKQAAEMAVSLSEGNALSDLPKMQNASYELPYLFMEPVAVTAENMDSAIIDSGFHRREDVYLERPNVN